MTVHWTEPALEDLRAIEVYLSGRSAQDARLVVDRIFSRSASLEDWPLLGPMVPEYRDGSLRELFEAPDRIVYRLRDTEIDIVIHSSRQMRRGS